VPIERGVFSTTTLDNDLHDLSCVLEREVRLLVVSEATLGPAAAEALRRLRREELHRALIVADLGEVLAIGPDPVLNDLLAAVPDAWAVALAAHSARLRQSRALPPSLRDFLES
jgi:hypothetical protein